MGFCALNTEPVDLATSPLGELDHLVLVRGDSATGQVTALVALYEHFQVIVRLGQMTFERSFVHAYRVNQLVSRDRRDAEEDLNLVVPPFSRLTDGIQQAWFDRMQAAMSAIFDVAMAKSRSAAVRELIKTTVDEVLGKPDGRTPTAEEIEKLARLTAERYVDMLQHLGAFRDDIPEKTGSQDGTESAAEDEQGEKRG